MSPPPRDDLLPHARIILGNVQGNYQEDCHPCPKGTYREARELFSSRYCTACPTNAGTAVTVSSYFPSFLLRVSTQGTYCQKRWSFLWSRFPVKSTKAEAIMCLCEKAFALENEKKRLNVRNGSGS